MSTTIGTPVNSTPESFESPQLTTPEQIDGLVAPGQENLVEEYAREQEQAAQEEAILGKFKSPYELAKAYSELQKKLGERSGEQSQETAQAEPESAPQETGSYTSEQAAERYGSAAVESLAEKGVDLGAVMTKADQGQDISEHYEALAETFNVSKEVVETFVQKSSAAPAAAAAGMSDADSAAIVSELGGQQQFDALQAWGRDNMSEAEKIIKFCI